MHRCIILKRVGEYSPTLFFSLAVEYHQEFGCNTKEKGTGCKGFDKRRTGEVFVPGNALAANTGIGSGSAGYGLFAGCHIC